ncbi:TIGR03668 family PPOX class F420-dependent oxidoreductase [Myceligenerans halotolerans]
MRLDEGTCRTRFAAARSATLATVGSDLWPHVVPVTFVAVEDVVFIGIDQKPKTTTNLRRLRNIADNDRVSLLCDEYSDEWTRLWWVRADGHADVVATGPDHQSAVRHLQARYSQYVDDPPRGPVIRVNVSRWSGWSFSKQLPASGAVKLPT